MQEFVQRFIITIPNIAVMYIISFIIFEAFFKPRFSRVVTLVYYGLSCVIHTVMSVIVCFGFFKGIFVFGTLLFLAVVMYSGKSVGKRVYCTAITMISFQVIDCINLLFYFCVGGYKDMVVDFSYTRQAAYLIASLIIDPFLVKPVLKIIEKQLQYPEYTVYKNLIIIALCFVELVFVNYMMSTSGVVELQHLASLCLRIFSFALLDIAFILGMNKLDKSYQLGEETRLMDQQLAMQQKYYQFLEGQYHDTRILAHDMKNHLLSLKRLYQNGETEKGDAYAQKILTEIDRMNADYANRLEQQDGAVGREQEKKSKEEGIFIDEGSGLDSEIPLK